MSHSDSHAPDAAFESLYIDLASKYPAPVLPPPKPHSQDVSHAISSLLVHPTLETILHLLNGDLPSAHFLLRHMQSPPAYEGMFLHGILHRIEGDYDNARAWYSDAVESEVFQSTWSEGKDAAMCFIGKIERLRKQGEGSLQGVEEESRRELESVVRFCVKKFGTAKLEDATKVWVHPEGKHKEMGQDMIVEGEGWRKF